MDSVYEQIADAIEQHQVAVVKQLVAENPDVVRAACQFGDTLLHLACWQKVIEVVPMLVILGSDVNAKGCDGRTPLHYAAHEGGSLTPGLFGFLLNHGADPEIRDNNGFTPFEWAQVECPEDTADLFTLIKAMR